MSKLDAVICRACKRPYAEHDQDRKCLFDAGKFSAPEEDVRRAISADINAAALERADLEKKWGAVWDTQQVQAEFQIHGFLAPFVSATRRTDGVRGSLTFQHLPRYYFSFSPL